MEELDHCLFLHRKEGDKFNAGLWYRMAGEKHFLNKNLERSNENWWNIF